MEVILHIPEDIASQWPAGSADVNRAVLEAFAVEGYRQRRLSAFQVRRLLGHESRWETEDFLAAHDAWPGLTAEEVAEDGRRLTALLSESQ